jgi:hypothetical protein
MRLESEGTPDGHNVALVEAAGLGHDADPRVCGVLGAAL